MTHCSTAVYHVITNSRAAQLVTDFLQGATPEIWIADRYGAQNSHARERQLCLAHLLRAIAVGKRRDGLTDPI